MTDGDDEFDDDILGHERICEILAEVPRRRGDRGSPDPRAIAERALLAREVSYLRGVMEDLTAQGRGEEVQIFRVDGGWPIGPGLSKTIPTRPQRGWQGSDALRLTRLHVPAFFAGHFEILDIRIGCRSLFHESGSVAAALFSHGIGHAFDAGELRLDEDLVMVVKNTSASPRTFSASWAAHPIRLGIPFGSQVARMIDHPANLGHAVDQEAPRSGHHHQWGPLYFGADVDECDRCLGRRRRAVSCWQYWARFGDREWMAYPTPPDCPVADTRVTEFRREVHGIGIGAGGDVDVRMSSVGRIRPGEHARIRLDWHLCRMEVGGIGMVGSVFEDWRFSKLNFDVGDVGDVFWELISAVDPGGMTIGTGDSLCALVEYIGERGDGCEFEMAICGRMADLAESGIAMDGHPAVTPAATRAPDSVGPEAGPAPMLVAPVACGGWDPYGDD